MIYIVTAFLTSLVVTLLVVRYSHLHAQFTADSDLTGVQKFHTRPVPRVGGVALLVALLVIWGLLWFTEREQFKEFGLLIVASLLAFAGGLAEDLTKKVRASVRLVLAMLAGGVGYYLLDGAITRIDIIGLDWLLQFGVFSLIFTMFAVGGAANAVNIIDGYNSLAAFVSATIFAGFAYVSFYLGDRLLLVSSVAMLGAIGGFFVWNYPKGLIFLGDGGAYLIGFMIGEISVLMLARHPIVSAWFPLLICVYPVFETLFSIYRKRLLRGGSPGMPDGVHLHMLVYRRLVRWAVGSRDEKRQVQRNAMTSPYLWLLSSLAVIPAVLFWQQQTVLMIFVFLFAVTYVSLYRAVVRFETPRWLVLTKRALGPLALGRGDASFPGAAVEIDQIAHQRVAILMGCYNGQTYLREQLDSIEAQTHRNWVLWVSDDGSTDDTAKILDEYRSRWGEDKLRVVDGPHQGFARNFLSLVARPEIEADFFAYCDQDDVWVASKLARALDVLERVREGDQPQLYCSRTLLVDAKSQPLGFSPLFDRKPGFKNALVQNIGGGNTMVFDAAARRIIAGAGWDLDVVAHDWWTYIAISAAGGHTIYDPKPALRYRQHGSNLIGSNVGMGARFGRVFKLFQGQWHRWNDANAVGLRRIDHALTGSARRTFTEFEAARLGSSLFGRYAAMKRAGVYRQTTLGNLGLIVAVLFKKM